jgi:hypothetical protein
MRIWWCNQGKCWAVEREASVICSSANVKRVKYRQTVGDIRTGDIILHYVKQRVVGVSLAKSDGKRYERLPLVGSVDYGSGWRVEAEYFVFNPVIPKKKFIKGLVEILESKGPKDFPVNRKSNVMQGYCFPFSKEGLQAVRDSFKTVWPAWVPAFGPTASAQPSAKAEQKADESQQASSKIIQLPDQRTAAGG